jgi:DNA-binding response OmpR family regulator
MTACFLIVEDEFLLTMEIKSILTDAGFQVTSAGTVAKALQSIASNAPDAALLDCNLNGQSIDAVATALKDLGVPIAFVTGYDRERLPSAFHDAPVVGKPFNPARLLDVAKGLLKARC